MSTCELLLPGHIVGEQMGAGEERGRLRKGKEKGEVKERGEKDGERERREEGIREWG